MVISRINQSLDRNKKNVALIFAFIFGFNFHVNENFTSRFLINTTKYVCSWFSLGFWHSSAASFLFSLSHLSLWCLMWLGWWCRTLEMGIFSNKVLEINERQWRCHLVFKEGKHTSLWRFHLRVEKGPALAKWTAEWWRKSVFRKCFINESSLGRRSSSTNTNDWSCLEITNKIGKSPSSEPLREMRNSRSDSPAELIFRRLVTGFHYSMHFTFLTF